jgi:hypothetical protein
MRGKESVTRLMITLMIVTSISVDSPNNPPRIPRFFSQLFWLFSSPLFYYYTIVVYYFLALESTKK